jgi:hypothetical protein
LYKIYAHSNLDNDEKTQRGSIEGVVPHDILWHQKNHFLNHKKWDKLSCWVISTSSKFEAQIQSAYGAIALGVTNDEVLEGGPMVNFDYLQLHSKENFRLQL